MSTVNLRWAALAGMIVILGGLRGEAAEPTSSFKGKVVEVKKQPGALALLCADGRMFRLVKDDGSMLLFKDPGLRRREVRLNGSLKEGSLRVSGVQTYQGGKLHDVYYWCDNCALAYSEPGQCQCCNEKVKRVEVEADVGAKPALLLKPR
ncbi:MAG: hypothetical protein U0840_00845 [Gemmataceae bacterium]